MERFDFSQKVSQDRIRNHIRRLEGIRHPEVSPEALALAADYIATTLADQGCDVFEHIFYDNGRPFRNVIGTLQGQGQNEPRLLVIAHYDTVAETPGADDNASGVAVMLEAATLLAPMKFDRPIHFIGVALEENAIPGDHGTGTRGSAALAQHARQNGWPVEAAVVLESVAYAGADCAQITPAGFPENVPKTGDFIAIIGNERSRGLVDHMAKVMSNQKETMPNVPLTVPGNGEMLPDSRRSDHAPFWDAGYRAIMLTDTANFRNPHYHYPGDTLETLNLEFSARVCSATCTFMAELAGASV